MRFKGPLPRPNRAFSIHPRTALKCLGVFGIIWFLLGVFVYRRSLLHRIADTGSSGSTDGGGGRGEQDFRSRVSIEQLHLSVMNSFATRPFTSIRVSGSKNHKQDILVHFTPSHRRAALHVGTDSLETLNVFLAYVVDFVSGSSDTIVPTTALRKLSKDDVSSIASAMAASGGPTLKEGDVVALVSRFGGFFTESLDENTKSPLCTFPYDCLDPQFDPFMDEEVCFVQLKTRGERKMVPLQQFDHSFVLDYLLFGNSVVKMDQRLSCGFVPDRAINGGVLFVGTGFNNCCCSNNDFNDVEDRSLIARMCKITSSISDRFAMFRSGKKTLGTAVREFLSSDQLPSEVRRVFDGGLSQGCLSKFFQTLDQRLEQLFKILETECPEREEMSNSDIYGQVPDRP